MKRRLKLRRKPVVVPFPPAPAQWRTCGSCFFWVYQDVSGQPPGYCANVKSPHYQSGCAHWASCQAWDKA